MREINESYSGVRYNWLLVCLLVPLPENGPLRHQNFSLQSIADECSLTYMMVTEDKPETCTKLMRFSETVPFKHTLTHETEYVQIHSLNLNGSSCMLRTNGSITYISYNDNNEPSYMPTLKSMYETA